MGHLAQNLPVDPVDLYIIGFAQVRGVLCNRIQHRFDVRRRGGNGGEYLSGGCLLLQRLGNFLFRFCTSSNRRAFSSATLMEPASVCSSRTSASPKASS